MTLGLSGLGTFVLVVVRLSGFALVAPLWSSDVINRHVKVAFLLALAIFLTGTLPRHDFALTATATMLPELAGEFLVGLVLGFGFRIAIAAASMAGELMGLQMGLSAATLLDPASGGDDPLLATFYGLLFTMLFLSFDGHHHMLRALAASYDAVPAGHALSAMPPVELLVKQCGEVLAYGFSLAAPVVLPLFLLTGAFALMARAFPQANILSFSYGLSIVVGCVLLAGSMPGVYGAAKDTLLQGDRFAGQILRALSGT